MFHQTPENIREQQGSLPAPVYHLTERRSQSRKSPDVISMPEEIRCIRDQEGIHDDPLDLFSNPVEYDMAIHSPMFAHSQQDMPSPFHYLYPTEIGHDNFRSKSGEDMLAATQTDIFEYDMVVDSTTGMPFPFVASYCGQLVLSNNREQSF
jgi:hypothetical protein